MIKLLRFGLVSGLGLATDVLLYVLLYRAGVAPGFANLLSASTAVTLVFVLSQRRVFRYGGRFLLPLFLGYVVYQVLAVTAASAGVAALVARAGLAPLAAKAVVTPITFACNYGFMTALFHRPGRGVPAGTVPASLPVSSLPVDGGR